ncbi:putative Syntaxin [Zostera marina]|uniref:Putative Syntaxin n=1 Tax=Zostera marina TaxID=29655 RepID=A0A0K9NJF2_ZOSMR|nr:putative Syntaxin [Zostera marina]
MAPRSDKISRDRTREFLAIVERLNKSAIPSEANASGSSIISSHGSNSSKTDGTRSTVSVHSEFNKRASKIGLGIYHTSQMLSKLALLAKKTGTYDDPTVEIQELTTVIKQDITALNSAVLDLQLLSNSQNESGDITVDITSHSSTVIDNLKNRLMTTTKDFKDVLTLRTEKMKVHENRKTLFSKKDNTNSFIRQRPVANRPMPSESTPLPWANESVTSSQLFSRRQVNGDASSSAQPLVQQQQLVSVHDTYMQSRSEALQNVESTIHELGNIFTQLATMVSQQGELAIRIDENMDDTLTNVEGAQGALLKYLNGISSNRWLMIKIFFVLVVFLTIFLFFVA